MQLGPLGRTGALAGDDVRGSERGELAAPPPTPTPPREPKNARGAAGTRRGGDRRVDVDVEADAGVDKRATTRAWTAREDACIVAVERVARSIGGCRGEDARPGGGEERRRVPCGVSGAYTTLRARLERQVELD